MPAPTVPSLWLRVPVLGGVGLLLALPAVLSVLSGAWGGERETVAATAQKFLDAIHHGDGPAIQESLGAAAPVAAVALPGTAHLRQPLLPGRIDAVAIQGDNAVAYYTLVRQDESISVDPALLRDLVTLQQRRQALAAAADKAAGQRGTLALRRVSGRWRVRAMTFPIDERGTGPTTAWDTNEALSLTPQQAEAFRTFEELAAVDPRDWERSWQADLDLKNVPARDALVELARRLGLPQPRSPQPALDKPITLRFRGRPVLEAVEEVCRQAGMHAGYDSGWLQVLPGRRVAPVAFAGPFLVESAGVKEFAPEPTGVLQLRCVAAGLPAPVAGLQRAAAWPWRIDAVTATDGRDLYHTANQGYYRGTVGQFPRPGWGPLYEAGCSVPLRHLLRDLDTIDRVRGRVALSLPVRVDVIRFDRLDPGADGRSGDVVLTIRQVETRPPSAGQAPRTDLEFDVAGIDGRRLWFAAYDGLGRKLTCGEPGLPRPDLARVAVSGEPAAVVFKVASLREVEYAFELRDVPLTQRAPRRLEPVRFPGHGAPVSVEFLGIGAAKDRVSMPFGRPAAKVPVVRLRLHNYSQKSVEKLQLRLAYLDAEGRTLKNAERTAATFNAAQGRLEVIASGAPFVVEEPDLPAGAVKAEVTVVGVGFADGSTWAP